MWLCFNGVLFTKNRNGLVWPAGYSLLTLILKKQQQQQKQQPTKFSSFPTQILPATVQIPTKGEGNILNQI